MLRVDVGDDEFWYDDDEKNVQVRTWKIEDDNLKLRLNVGWETDNGAFYQPDDVELSKMIIEALAERHYEVIVLESTTPLATLTAEQMEVLYPTFYVKSLVEKPAEETPEERVDRLLKEKAAELPEPDYDNMSLDEILALNGFDGENTSGEETQDEPETEPESPNDEEKPEE